MIKSKKKHILHHVKHFLKRKKSNPPISYSDVDPEKEFYVNDGRKLKNIKELAMALKDMPIDVFHYHVNKEEDDFANWIQEVIGSKSLAKKLANVKNKEQYSKIVNNQIKRLELG